MAKQSFTTGQVLLASQLTDLQQTALLGGAASSKTANYTLVSADAGTAISMTSTSATTITVNTGLFSNGDTVLIQNLGSGNCTITAGSATVNTAGSLILPQYDAGILKFVSASSAVFYDFIQVGATSPLTTKGDLYGFSTSDQRIPIGANDTVLTADSTQSLGLKWAAPAAGGLTLIQETAASSLTSLSFTSISGSYKQLLLIWSGIRHGTTGNEFAIRLNNSSSSVYNSSGFHANWAGAYSLEGFSRTSLSLVGYMPFGSNCNLSNVVTDAAGSLLIDNYASTTKTKTFDLKFNYYDYANDNYRAYDRVGFFNDTAAITSIDIVRLSGSGNFSNQNNTTIRLYGVS